MRLLPSDPDVETIVTRIETGDLNLQPDFQRGEVWSTSKKQRLIDSILRDWHVPPIHVIELSESRRQEVLDGQQRLVAIRDFRRGDFPVDGRTEPIDSKIAALDGLTYQQLPPESRRQFNHFTIRIFRIVDYQGSEPAELFFRLNQPTNLTAAEQRNAFFGPVREQIKELVSCLPEFGLQRDFLGFSNARMAYHDVLSRVALSVERNSISEKITSADLVDLYRNDKSLSSATTSKIRDALQFLGEASSLGKLHPRFNKATIYSWLILLIRMNNTRVANILDSVLLAQFMEHFAMVQLEAPLGFEPESTESESNLNRYFNLPWFLEVYNDRSTSRVADVSSVLLRDVALWMFVSDYISQLVLSAPLQVLPPALANVTERPNDSLEEDLIVKTAMESGWGKLL